MELRSKVPASAPLVILPNLCCQFESGHCPEETEPIELSTLQEQALLPHMKHLMKLNANHHLCRLATPKPTIVARQLSNCKWSELAARFIHNDISCDLTTKIVNSSNISRSAASKIAPKEQKRGYGRNCETNSSYSASNWTLGSVQLRHGSQEWYWRYWRPSCTLCAQVASFSPQLYHPISSN